MDIVELAKLEQELFEEHLNEQTLLEEIQVGFGWLIEDEAGLKSYILVRDDSYIIDITRFGTRTPYQGEGHGSRLLAQVLSYTSRAIMLTADSDNLVAMRLYLKNGFKIVGRLPHDLSWVLRKDAKTCVR